MGYIFFGQFDGREYKNDIIVSQLELYFRVANGFKIMCSNVPHQSRPTLFISVNFMFCNFGLAFVYVFNEVGKFP